MTKLFLFSYGLSQNECVCVHMTVGKTSTRSSCQQEQECNLKLATTHINVIFFILAACFVIPDNM